MKGFFKFISIFVLVIFVVLIMGVIGGVIFVKTFDIHKYKPQIVQSLSQSLGRVVSIGDLDLQISFDKGIRLRLVDLTIGENPEFGAADFVAVKEVVAGVDIVSYFVSHRVLVPQVLLRDPRVQLIRNKRGVLNVQTLGSAPSVTTSPSTASSSSAWPAILIDAFKIENAEVVFIDQLTSPEIKMGVSQFDFDVQNFSLTSPFDVFARAAILSTGRNFQFKSQVELNVVAKSAKLRSSEVQLDLGSLPLKEIKTWPMLANVPLPQAIDGNLKILLKDVVISDHGLGPLSFDMILSDGKVEAPDIVPGISIHAQNVNLDLVNVVLGDIISAEARLKAGLYQEQPNVDVQAKLQLDPKTMDVHVTEGRFTTDFTQLPLQKIQSEITALKNYPLPEHLAGQLQATIKDIRLTSSGLTSLLLDAKWQDGALTLNHLLPGKTIAIAKTDVTLTDFSFDKPFSLSLKTAYLNDEPNITFDGIIVLDLAKAAAAISGAGLEVDLDHLALDQLRSTGMVPEDVPLPQNLAGKLKVILKKLNVSSQGLGAMDAGLDWQNGAMSLKEIAPGVSVAASHIQAQITNFDFGAPFKVDIKLAYLSDEPNIQVRGTATYDLKDSAVNLQDLTTQVDLSKINLENLKTNIAALKDVSLPESLKGDLEVVVTKLAAGPQGLAELSGQGTLNHWDVKIKELPVALSGNNASFNFTASQFALDKFEALLDQGQVKLKGIVNQYMASPDFDVTGEFKNIELKNVLDQSQAQVKVTGAISGNFKAKGSVANLNGMSGDGHFEGKEVKLKDLNILKTVLDKISFLPNIVSRVESGLSEKYKSKLSDADTTINKVSTDWVMAEGKINLEPVSVQADEFVFDGKCLAGLDQTYDVDGAVKIPQELSLAMQGSVNELEYLFDKEGLIALPVHVKGHGADQPKFEILQTGFELGKNAARTQAKKELKNVVGKYLGVEMNPQKQPVPSDEPQPQSTDPASQIIDGVLDKIFK